MARSGDSADPVRIDPAGAVDVAQQLAASGGRRLLGITGPPGAGKSTLAAAVVEALGPAAVLVPMDGFHLDAEELTARGLCDVKGAPETFDVPGYLDLLRRMRAGEDVRAPAFDRTREQTVPAALSVPASTQLVVTEGNYLLLDRGAWSGVRELLDACWYVEVPDDLRVPRLVARHVAYGRDLAAATEWVQRSDEANARLIADSRHRADLVVTLG